MARSMKRDLTTNIATADATSITVRGRKLVDELIGQLTYTEMLYFLVCGRTPEPSQTLVLDACLVTLMEHGLNPSTLVTRLIADSVPGEIQVAMSAGLLAIGGVFAGTMEGCARILQAGVQAGGNPDAYCVEVVRAHRSERRPVPGFGHATHTPDDPRTPRLLTIAEQAGFGSGPYIAMLRQLAVTVVEAAGRHLTINATGAIAALLLEIDIPLDAMRGMAVVSRSGGLVGHVLEERRTHSARQVWRAAEEGIPYTDPTPGPASSSVGARHQGSDR